jgi:plasmid stabilization system protein ParE
MKLILSPRAELDFEAQVRWLQLHSPVAGRAAALCIVQTIDLLAVQFGRDGFVIRYRRSGQTLIVLRIFHSRQNRLR